MGQTSLSLVPILWMFKTKQKFFFDRTLTTKYGSNRIVLSSKFVGNVGKCNADWKQPLY